MTNMNRSTYEQNMVSILLAKHERMMNAGHELSCIIIPPEAYSCVRMIIPNLGFISQNMTKICFLPTYEIIYCLYMQVLKYYCSINSLRPSDAYVLINLTIIGLNNGLLPVWCQIIIWTDDGLVSTGPLRINTSEIWIKLQWLSYKKMIWKCLLQNGDGFVSASMC